MKKHLTILTLGLVLLLSVSSCGDLFGPSKSIVGTWGMVSGGIKERGEFTSLDEKDGAYYKTMKFLEDGTFIEICGELTATGTYSQGGSSITYSYTDAPTGGPAYFAIHKSGSWMYYFMEEDSFMLYDYASSTEVSMRLKLIE